MTGYTTETMRDVLNAIAAESRSDRYSDMAHDLLMRHATAWDEYNARLHGHMDYMYERIKELVAEHDMLTDALEHCGYDPLDCIDCGGPPHNDTCRFWKLRDIVPDLFVEAEESSTKRQYTCAQCGKPIVGVLEAHSDGDDDYHPECCPVCITQEGE